MYHEGEEGKKKKSCYYAFLSNWQIKVNIHFTLCLLFHKSQSSIDHSYVNKEELEFQKFSLLRNILDIN